MTVTFTEIQRAVRWGMVDDYGYSYSHQLAFPLGTLVQDLTGYASLYVPVLRGVSDCGVLEYRILVTYAATDSDPAGVGSDVTDSMTLLLNNVVGGLNEVNLPAINPALLLTSGPNAGLSLDATLTVVQNYITELTSFCNDQGDMNVSLATSSREVGGQFR